MSDAIRRFVSDLEDAFPKILAEVLALPELAQRSSSTHQGRKAGNNGNDLHSRFRPDQEQLVQVHGGKQSSEAGSKPGFNRNTPSPPTTESVGWDKLVLYKWGRYLF